MIQAAPERLNDTRNRIEHLRIRDLEIFDEIAAAMLAGSDATALRNERRAVRDETEDLHALATALEQDIRSAMADYRLQIARAEQRMIPLQRQLPALHARRVAAFEEGLRLARLSQPAPGFADNLAEIETEIAATETQIAEAEVATEAIRGPLRILEGV
jgi:chromosome segregation ATPase